MKRFSPHFSILLLLILLCPSAAQAQITRGIVKEGLTIDSEILGRPVRYTIYLPYDYETSSRYYPVVYLLHGFGDNDMGWVQFGEANLIADEAIATREIPPMIIAMPDGGPHWYVNNYDGSVRYEDFFIEEFMPHIESTYRIRTERRYRGVAGLSMGGYGSLVYAMKHPELFAAVAAFSSGVRTDEEYAAMPPQAWARVDGPIFGPNLQGQDRLTPHLRANSPIHIAREKGREGLQGLRIYMDSGDDDFLYKGNATLHITLRDLNIPHEFRVRDGGHTWSYWRTGLADGLAFIGTSFHQP